MKRTLLLTALCAMFFVSSFGQLTDLNKKPNPNPPKGGHQVWYYHGYIYVFMQYMKIGVNF